VSSHKPRTPQTTRVGGVSARTVVGAAALVVAAALIVACSSNNDAATPSDPAAATTIDSIGGSPPPTTMVDDQSIGPPDRDELNDADVPRACAMVSTDEVGTAIGATPSSADEVDRNGILTCSYADDAHVMMATIEIVTAEADPVPSLVFAQFADADAETVEHVDGFGDDAVWADDALHVSVDGEVVTFTIPLQETLGNSEAVRSATLELAGIAMPRYAMHAPAA
jgi:hypothetical protein